MLLLQFPALVAFAVFADLLPVAVPVAAALVLVAVAEALAFADASAFVAALIDCCS